MVDLCWWTTSSKLDKVHNKWKFEILLQVDVHITNKKYEEFHMELLKTSMDVYVDDAEQKIIHLTESFVVDENSVTSFLQLPHLLK